MSSVRSVSFLYVRLYLLRLNRRKHPSLRLPAFFKRSCPPHPTPTLHPHSALNTVCLVTHGGTGVHLYFLRVYLSLLPTSQDKEAHEGSAGGNGEDARTQVDAGKKKEGWKEGRREAFAISFWSAAKCTERSGGNARAVHLFKPAGRRFTLDTPPRGGGESAVDGFICCRQGPGSEAQRSGSRKNTENNVTPPHPRDEARIKSQIKPNGSTASAFMLRGFDALCPSLEALTSFITSTTCSTLQKQRFNQIIVNQMDHKWGEINYFPAF